MFKISRITTEKGIFRLQGQYHADKIAYSKAEFMGTDGWVELDLSSESAQSVLSGITDKVIQHLKHQT